MSISKIYKPKIKNSIQKKIIKVILITVSIAFIISSIYSYKYFFNVLKEQTVHNEEQKLLQTAYQLKNKQNEMISIARQIAIDEEIQRILKKDRNLDVFDRLVEEDYIRKQLAIYITMKPYLCSVGIIRADRKIFSSNQTERNFDFAKESWYKEFKANRVNQGFSKVHLYTVEQGTLKREVISYVMSFKDIQCGHKVIGDIIINVGFSELVKELIPDEYLLKGYGLYDRWGNRIIGYGEITPSIEEILQTIKSKETLSNGNIILTNTDLQDQWILVSEISEELLLRRLRYIKYFFIIVYLVVFCTLFLITHILIGKFMKPINLLHQAAIEVGKGNFEIHIDIKTHDEWEVLGNTFNQMVDNVQELILASINHEKVIKEIEISRLMLQINPHFIYNTLNSIVYMAQIAENEDIIRFTNAFISLLQDTLSIKENDIFVTMRQEMKNVEHYLILQKYRYPNKFDIEYSLDESILDCKVPNVLVQPIVENAIFHGLSSKLGKGTLKIILMKKQEDVIIRIEDNGVGMSEEQMKKLLEHEKSNSSKMRTIGIANVCKRIENIYGEGYGITITSKLDQGTSVKIKIPYHQYEAS